MHAPTFPDELNLADHFLFDRLAEPALRDKAAILFGDRRLTYAEVADQARALRGQLAVAGVAREQRVLVVLPDTPAFVRMFGIHCPGPSSVAAVSSMHATISRNAGRRHAANIAPVDTPEVTRSVRGKTCPRNAQP